MRTAVLAAAVAELGEQGLAGLSLPRVAERAGVALTTIHRRWGSKAGLIADLFGELIGTAVPDPEGASLREDLHAIARTVAVALTEPLVVALLRSVAGLPESEQAVLRTAFWESRFALSRAIADRAIARGELPPGTDGWLLFERVTAPIWMRVLITALPVEDQWIDSLVDAVITPFAGSRS